jgi:peptidoglycan/LPS O-acetylase OafA/YrhL
MSELLYVIVLIVFWVAVAIGCHSYIKNYFLASFVAACLMVLGVQIASYVELGYMDKFWPIAAVTGFFMASIVALIVGIPFKLKRDVKNEDV